MVISIKKWMEKWHFSPHFQTQMDQAEIGAVGPTAEHLSRHCAHRLSKVMPTDVFLNPPYSILSHPNHSPICQVFQHSFICWCAEACWTHELLRSARTTAMRTPSRFYKAPEKKADVAIDFPKWWEYKKRNIKNCQKNPSHHQISHHHPSFSECSKVFPWFSQPFTSCICSGELNCILDSCNATDEIPVGYVGEAWQFQWGKWRVIWSFVGLTIPWKRKAPTSQFTEYNIEFFLLANCWMVVLFNANGC